MWLSGCLDHFGSLLLGLPCNDGQNEHLNFFGKKTQTLSKNYVKFAGAKNLARSIEKLEKKKREKKKTKHQDGIGQGTISFQLQHPLCRQRCHSPALPIEAL